MLKKKTKATNSLLHDMLAFPLEGIVRSIADFRTWRTIWEDVGNRWERSVERSICAGLLCDRLAWAFAAGYQGAIQALFPGLPAGVIAAICISESGGNHPRAIQTKLNRTKNGCRLNGEKQFITAGENADRLAVAASTGMQDGRNRIRMVWVDRDAAGLVLQSMPPLPFIPEIAHSTAHFQNVPVPPGQVTPGDGYIQAVKPFRTIEDLHVTGAVLGHLLGVARRCGWPDGIVEQICLLIVTVAALARENPLSPATHMAMGGLFEQIDTLLAALEPLWPKTDPRIARRWQRDKPVLEIADKARRRRLAAAKRHYGM